MIRHERQVKVINASFDMNSINTDTIHSHFVLTAYEENRKLASFRTWNTILNHTSNGTPYIYHREQISWNSILVIVWLLIKWVLYFLLNEHWVCVILFLYTQKNELFITCLVSVSTKKQPLSVNCPHKSLDKLFQRIIICGRLTSN